MKLFSKHNDYNLILEKILDSKYFSSNTKSLLLSMVYKIENCYGDYQRVKGIEQTKEKFLEILIDIIKKYCYDIKLVEPESKEAIAIKQHGLLALTNEKEKSILSYPTEISLLYAVSDIVPKYFYIPEKYILKEQFQNILVNGYNENNLEILSDFNGWSWDLNLTYKNNIIDNLIYQNLLILFGTDFMNGWLECSSSEANHFEVLKGEVLGTKFIETLTQYLYFTLEDKKKVDKIIKVKKEELKKISDKPKFSEECKKEKMKLLTEIEKLDKLLNNKEILMNNYITENLKLKESKRFSTINAYRKELEKRREICLKNIQSINYKQNPVNYIKYKKELEDIALIDESTIKDKNQYIKKIQLEFLKALEEKVGYLENEEEIISYIYKIRYYKYLYLDENMQVKDDTELLSRIDDIMESLIEKACEKEIIRVISQKFKVNVEIIKNILDNKIINLEEIRFEVNYKAGKIIVTVYDKEVYEKDFELSEKMSKKELELLVKPNKLLKLFI